MKTLLATLALLPSLAFAWVPCTMNREVFVSYDDGVEWSSERDFIADHLVRKPEWVPVAFVAKDDHRNGMVGNWWFWDVECKDDKVTGDWQLEERRYGVGATPHSVIWRNQHAAFEYNKVYRTRHQMNGRHFQFIFSFQKIPASQVDARRAERAAFDKAALAQQEAQRRPN